MTTFVVTTVLFGVFMLLAGVGVLLKRKPLEGSCGGLKSFKGLRCLFCGKKRDEDCPRPLV